MFNAAVSGASPLLSGEVVKSGNSARAVNRVVGTPVIKSGYIRVKISYLELLPDGVAPFWLRILNALKCVIFGKKIPKNYHELPKMPGFLPEITRLPI